MDEERWYTVEELAERWRVNPETVRRWIRTRQLTVLRLGDKAGYRVGHEEVARFERERMIERVQDG
jgi:excisionase family DNA binding protein